MRPNGTLEDISAVVGFSATTRLVAWYGGKTLNIPTEARDTHPLNMILGTSAFKMLVEEWPGDAIKVPTNAESHEALRHRAVAVLFNSGMVARDIGTVLYMTPQHVNRLRVEAEELGVLEKIMKGSTRSASGTLQENPVHG